MFVTILKLIINVCNYYFIFQRTDLTSLLRNHVYCFVKINYIVICRRTCFVRSTDERTRIDVWNSDVMFRRRNRKHTSIKSIKRSELDSTLFRRLSSPVEKYTTRVDSLSFRWILPSDSRHLWFWNVLEIISFRHYPRHSGRRSEHGIRMYIYHTRLLSYVYACGM